MSAELLLHFFGGKISSNTFPHRGGVEKRESPDRCSDPMRFGALRHRNVDGSSELRHRHIDGLSKAQQQGLHERPGQHG